MNTKEVNVISVVPRSGCVSINKINGIAGRIAPIISLRLFIPFLYFSIIQNAIITIIAIFTNSDG